MIFEREFVGIKKQIFVDVVTRCDAVFTTEEKEVFTEVKEEYFLSLAGVSLN